MVVHASLLLLRKRSHTSKQASKQAPSPWKTNEKKKKLGRRKKKKKERKKKKNEKRKKKKKEEKEKKRNEDFMTAFNFSILLSDIPPIDIEQGSTSRSITVGRVPKTVFVLVLAEVEVECLLHFQLCAESFPCGASWSEGAEYT